MLFTFKIFNSSESVRPLKENELKILYWDEVLESFNVVAKNFQYTDSVKVQKQLSRTTSFCLKVKSQGFR
jgi:hypothetical protein